MANDPLDQRYGETLDKILAEDPCYFMKRRADVAADLADRAFVSGALAGSGTVLAGVLSFVLARRLRLVRRPA